MWKLVCVIVAGALTGWGCRHNPYRCEGVPDPLCEVQGGAMSCGSNGDCTAPAAVCDLAGSMTLDAGSGVADRADPAATLAIDLEGEARPKGGGRDLGADEQRRWP